MRIKSILLISFINISFQLSAQIVAISEGTSSNFKTLLELPDGSVLAGIDANFYGESYSNFTLLKFDNKGQLDERFGNQGKYRYKAPRGTEEEKEVMHIKDMLLLKDGKIMVAGHKKARSNNVFLLRLLPNGVPDSSFGQYGYSVLDHTDLSNEALIRLTKSDNNDYFIGYINEGGRISSIKVNESGVMDMSYGNGNGLFSYKNENQKAYFPNEGNIEKDSKNRLYFTTFCQSDEDGHIMQIYRVTEDGKLDKDFADNGVRKLLTDKKYREYFKAGNTTFLPDNKILISTKYYDTKNNISTGYHIVFKLNENGTPDLTFADKGMATITITPGDNQLSRIATLADGKIMTWDIADLTASENLKTKVLVSRRFGKSGQLDNTFGKNGLGLNTLLQIPGVIDFKGMNITEQYFYVFGFSYLKVDDPWLSTIIKLKKLPNNNLEDVIKNDFVYSTSNESGVIGLTITDVNSGKVNTNSVAITKGDQGGKQPNPEEKNLMAMIKTLVNEAEKVKTVFTTFDKKQMSGGVVSLDFVTNSGLLEKAIKNYYSVSNSFANGKYGIRNIGWKNYVPLSLFVKRENELTEEMKNLIVHINKCLEYIDKFTRDNKRMPAGVGNYMEMADYKFSKRIDEFIKTYKSIILE